MRSGPRIRADPERSTLVGGERRAVDGRVRPQLRHSQLGWINCRGRLLPNGGLGHGSRDVHTQSREDVRSVEPRIGLTGHKDGQR